MEDQDRFDYYNDILVSNADSFWLERALSHDAENTVARLISNQGNYLSVDQVKKINSELNKIRERLLAISLYMLGNKSSTAQDLPNNRTLGLRDLSSSDIGVLHFEESGAIHATLRNNRMIMLPEQFDEDSWKQFYTDMSAYYKRELNGTNWVIDFSSLYDTTENFWANIIAYNYKLKTISGQLFLCWVHEDVLPTVNTEVMCEFLRLKRIGKYFFSTI